MSFNHININQLTNLEANYYLGVKARACAQRMKIGKDKVYRYYKLFMQGLTVQEIYNQYLINKSRCGRKPIVLSKEKLDDINNKLENDWSLDAIAGRDKIDGKDEKISTKTLYKLAKQGVIDINKLNRNQIQNYKYISMNNARLENLKEILFKNEFEKLLWIPSSKPYYITNSIFDKNTNASKILIFSSWEMVPKMIAGMISYEAERLTVGKLYNSEKEKSGKGYFIEEDKRKFLRPRLIGPRSKTLTLASKTLADMFNPLDYIGENIKDIRVELETKVSKKLNEIKTKYGIGESPIGDVSWYINAPLIWDGEILDVNHRDMPIDTAKVITNMIIGSPAVCAMRIFNDKNMAEKLGELFVSLFNKPESIAAVDLFYERRSERTYYKNVLAYLVDGNIQAVLDEYAHSLGVKGEDLIEQISEGMNLRTSTLDIDTYESFVGKRKKSGLRAHFAVGYYNAKGDNDNIQRTENIRAAFNSPFRPFVLATTSIGQEGLDFHLNCRKIVHWNLPSNPIDLEQREGRINRFKCLAIRQNIAKKYGDIKFKQDIWEEMFDEASKQEKGENSDLVPYWSLANINEETIKIERIVPMYPMSKDQVKYNRLIKVLSLYRLTLGQPRQEELLNSLGSNFDNEDNIDDLFINLSPFKHSNENNKSFV